MAVAGLLGLLANAAQAERISLDVAVQRTLDGHPSLRAEQARAESIRQQGLLDDQKPAPSVAAEFENLLGSGDVSGIRGAETTLRLSQVIELGGKREARRARTDRLSDIQQHAQALRRLDLALATTLRFIAVTQGQQALALAGQQWRLAQATERFVGDRVERGAAPESDLALARIARVRAEIDREHAEHELAAARFALASLWGQAEPAVFEAAGELFELPQAAEFDALARKLASSPESIAWTLEADRIDAERALATTAARPDLALSLGVRRLEAFDDQALVMSLSLPLGTRQRASLATARIDAERESLDARAEAALLEARQILFARYQELRHARTEFEALSLHMLPEAERGLESIRTGYEEARYSILQLSQAQALLIDLRKERLEAAARYHRLLAEIERSTAIGGELP